MRTFGRYSRPKEGFIIRTKVWHDAEDYNSEMWDCGIDSGTEGEEYASIDEFLQAKLCGDVIFAEYINNDEDEFGDKSGGILNPFKLADGLGYVFADEDSIQLNWGSSPDVKKYGDKWRCDDCRRIVTCDGTIMNGGDYRITKSNGKFLCDDCLQK